MNENPEDTADERDSRRSFLDEVTARPREIDVAMDERRKILCVGEVGFVSDSMIFQNDIYLI